jgi:hypothetical protein
MDNHRLICTTLERQHRKMLTSREQLRTWCKILSAKRHLIFRHSSGVRGNNVCMAHGMQICQS